MGLLNLAQLLPIYPLDGGRIFVSIAKSWSPRFARLLVATLCVTALLWALWSRDPLLGVLGFVGISFSTKSQWELSSNVRRMSKTECLSIVAGTLATTLILLIPVLKTEIVVNAVIGYHKPSLAAALPSDVAKNGSYTITPRFDLSTGPSDVKQYTFVVGDESNGGRDDWRIWGRTDREDSFVLVKLTEVSNYSNIHRARQSLRDLVQTELKSRGADVNFEDQGDSLPLDGPYGQMDSIPFKVLNDDLEKYCRAVHGFAASGSIYIYAVLCNDAVDPANSRITKEQAACFLSGLRIDGLPVSNAMAGLQCPKGANTLNTSQAAQ